MLRAMAGELLELLVKLRFFCLSRGCLHARGAVVEVERVLFRAGETSERDMKRPFCLVTG